MKTQIVYVITSSEHDYYYEQAYMSAYSLRQHNLDARVLVVIDKQTEALMQEKSNDIKDYADDVLVFDTPEGYSQKERSRYLKTNLRQLISGDYLFIDTDTIIVTSLADIDKCTADVAAVASDHNNLIVKESDEWIVNNAKRVGWDDIVGCEHYNSGVFYVKDSERAHTLYKEWYRLWLESSSMGVYVDQLPLTKANKDLGNVIKQLDDTWNCQIHRSIGVSLIPVGKIIHYFAGNKFQTCLLGREEILREVRTSGITERVKSLIANPSSAFIQDSKIVVGPDLRYLKSSIHAIFLSYPSFFRKLENLANIYLKTRGFLGSLKCRLLKKNNTNIL